MTIDTTRPTLFPVLTYTDAHAAIGFLVEAFGLTADIVHTDESGRVEHAVLGWPGGGVMLSAQRTASSPFALGPACLYVVVDDPDAHYAVAEAAGAEMVMGLVDQSYGSREYAARDPEGNVWCFGTYQPALAPDSASASRAGTPSA
jgi:uncharacterized glyoxalase superfamily protein PhnB